MLIQSGATVAALNNDGKRAADLAKCNNYQGTLTLIQERLEQLATKLLRIVEKERAGLEAQEEEEEEEEEEKAAVDDDANESRASKSMSNVRKDAKLVPMVLLTT
jgi:hypothetical protein